MANFKPNKLIEKATSDLASFGLEAPSTYVRVDLHDGTELMLLVGDPGPIAEKGKPVAYYVRTGANSDVYMMQTEIITFLSKGPGEFRDMHVFGVDASTVQSVTIEKTGLDPLHLEKQTQTGGAKWLLREPVAAPADSPAVEALTHGLEGLKAAQVISDGDSQLADYGLADAELRLTFQVAAQASEAQAKKLLIGKTVPDNPQLVYAKQEGEPIIYLVSHQDLAEMIPTSLGQVILKDLIPAATDDLSAIRWQGVLEPEEPVDATVELRRSEEKSSSGEFTWAQEAEAATWSAPKKKELEGSQLRPLLAALGQFWARDAELPDEGQKSAGELYGELTVEWAEGSRQLTVEPAAEGFYRVTADDSPLVYMVSEDVVQRLVGKLTELVVE
jgi:hypothetical protein